MTDPTTSQVEESSGVLAAIANNPSLIEPLKERYLVWQALIEAGEIDPTLATVLRLAADGLWYNDLLGLAPMDDDQRQL